MKAKPPVETIESFPQAAFSLKFSTDIAVEFLTYSR